MSLINWGNESAAQLDARRRMEQEYLTLVEQAIRAGKGQSPGVAGSGVPGPVAPPISFYAYGFLAPGIGCFTSIDVEGKMTQIGDNGGGPEPGGFNGVTVFCRNSDNGNMYYVSMDTATSEMVVGIINVSTGALTELDRSVLTAVNYSPPTSLVYVGSNTFLYVANNLFLGEEGTTQEIIELQISGSVVTPTLLSTYDSTLYGLSLTGIFSLDGEYWAAVSTVSPPIAGFGKIDPTTATLTDSGISTLVGFPFVEIYKVIFTLGISQSPSGKIYLSQFVIDKATSDEYVVVSEADPENYQSIYVQLIIPDPILGIVPIDIEIA